ncbi:D-xylose ABC transporter ATP-binding protein [Nibricoccus aquaticus]|uniref:D-xylose ABC transporter ATP-binding protein n=1 Tax=Nibricoccus aquaticus TaxID=2576891 RepID=A0A290Q677_9BACT|nr:sugar ABC transporter ATP-binding protein [Nibricoccus aquaticus]ATC63777.1 D-xylose ABC transporter ATP-binding protein [Nibricoccus aquaticus]
MLLETRNLTKRFPGVVALKNVCFGLKAGEIHALCGENGAGKSTLIKLLSGIHPHGSYEGELLVDGSVAEFKSIRDSEAQGIAVITQEFALVDELSVAENIFLGREPRLGWRIDWHKLRRRSAELLAEFGLPLSPDTLVGDLGVGHKQLVEIVRAMDKKSRVLVLDEPTAALTEQEVAVLLKHLRRLRSQGTACIYISHKLDEVFAICDRITVLRDGASITTLTTREATIPQVIKNMVGREITDLFPRKPSTTDRSAEKPVLTVRGLDVAPDKGTKAFLRGLDFELRPGEVLGFGGLMGAGRTELLMHIFGAWGSRICGDVSLRGEDYAKPQPRDSIRRGLVLVSEDRKRYGLVLGQDIGFNFSLSSLKSFSGFGGRIDTSAEYARNQHFFDSLRVKAPNQQARAGGLSGGNQQKIVIGKALMTEPTVVMLDEPTRGIDVGAKLEVYELINRLTAEGKAVILVSSELPELMGMSDRIIMLCEGKIGGVFNRAEFTQEKLLAAAMGKSSSAAA